MLHLLMAASDTLSPSWHGTDRMSVGVGRPTGRGRLGRPQIRQRGPNSDEIAGIHVLLRGRAGAVSNPATAASVRSRMQSAAGSQPPSATRLAPSAPSVFTLIRPQKAYAMLYYTGRLNSGLEAHSGKPPTDSWGCVLTRSAEGHRAGIRRSVARHCRQFR